MDRAMPTVLTPRQQEVLRLVRRGLTNREIGGELGITEDGVKAHLSRLFLRFGVTNRVELLAAVERDARSDRALSADAPLGELRAIAGRANQRTQAITPTSNDNGLAGKLTAVRDALAAVDAALALVGDLTPETTGPVVTAVRRRLSTAFDALDTAQREAAQSS
jgi:DNA-binding CsgD family transcriptional regulator